MSEPASPEMPATPMQADASAPTSPKPSAEEESFRAMCVGIDLGNLNCRVSKVNKESQMPTIVRNNLSNEQTPTIVSFREGQQRQVGDDAAPKLSSMPQSTINNIKRVLGVEPTQEIDMTGINYKLNNGLIDICLEGAETTSISPTQVLAPLFKRLLGFARGDKLPETVMPGSVTVSVPESFTQAQRSAVRDALEIAGVPTSSVSIISEAMAQLLYFHHSHYCDLSDKAMAVVLVDVGHSQSSVTLAQVTKSSIKVIATKGTPVGAGSVDMEMLKGCVEYIKTKHNLDVTTKPKALARIEREAKKCKEMLSMLEKATLSVESLTDEIDLQQPVDKATLQDYAKPLGEALILLCKEVMDASMHAATGDSVWSVETVDRVEILGGGARMPYLQAELEAYWERKMATTMDSSLSICQGAALYPIIQPPTADTARILANNLSKADEARTIMETIHHVELIPSIEPTESLLPEGRMQEMMEVEAKLQARDQDFINKENAKNELEAYIYSMRNKMDAASMQKAVGDDLSKIREILNKGEEWLWDEGDSASTEQFQTKLQEVKTAMDTFAAIGEELQRQAEEQAKKDQEMAEEARKAQAEMVKEPRTDAERVKFAEERKDQGNQLFKQEHFQECITRYVQALAYLGEMYGTEDLKIKKDEISLSCNLNIASASIKLGMFDKAVANCDKALEIKETPKAHFRKGQALAGKQDFNDAKKSLNKALELAPGDKAIEKEIKSVDKKMEAHKAKEKKLYGKMFG